jgi:hypothetical protein
MYAGLVDLDRADTGDDLAGRHVPVANDLSTALPVDQMGVLVDPLLNLGFNRLSQQRLGALTQDRSQNIVR